MNVISGYFGVLSYRLEVPVS